jgi:hypothetical protein
VEGEASEAAHRRRRFLVFGAGAGAGRGGHGDGSEVFDVTCAGGAGVGKLSRG